MRRDNTAGPIWNRHIKLERRKDWTGQPLQEKFENKIPLLTSRYRTQMLQKLITQKGGNKNTNLEHFEVLWLLQSTPT